MGWIYAGITLVLAFLWPFLFHEALPQPYMTFALIANGLVAVIAWYQCSSRECPFFAGLREIADSSDSGCANVTIVYMPFLMAWVYVACIHYSVGGLFHGRRTAQERFLGLVDWFDENRLGKPIGHSQYLKPFDPAEPEVHPDDPDWILKAAAKRDRQGDWDRAIAMYAYVRSRWPELHGRYATYCIREIKRKKAWTDRSQMKRR